MVFVGVSSHFFIYLSVFFFFSSRRRHTSCALVTGVQTCALPISWQRDGASREQPRFPSGLAFRHIGLYAYRVAALAEFSSLPAAPLEDCEALEQLRALTHGFRIRMGITEKIGRAHV